MIEDGSHDDLLHLLTQGNGEAPDLHIHPRKVPVLNAGDRILLRCRALLLRRQDSRAIGIHDPGDLVPRDGDPCSGADRICVSKGGRHGACTRFLFQFFQLCLCTIADLCALHGEVLPGIFCFSWLSFLILPGFIGFFAVPLCRMGFLCPPDHPAGAPGITAAECHELVDIAEGRRQGAALRRVSVFSVAVRVFALFAPIALCKAPVDVLLLAAVISIDLLCLPGRKDCCGFHAAFSGALLDGQDFPGIQGSLLCQIGIFGIQGTSLFQDLGEFPVLICPEALCGIAGHQILPVRIQAKLQDDPGAAFGIELHERGLHGICRLLLPLQAGSVPCIGVPGISDLLLRKAILLRDGLRCLRPCCPPHGKILLIPGAARKCSCKCQDRYGTCQIPDSPSDLPSPVF